MRSHPFKVGDVIISKNGTRPLTLDYNPSNSYDSYRAVYVHNGRAKYIEQYNISNYELYSEQNTMKLSTSLFSFTKSDNSVAYGTHIGINSKGEYLIEEKVTGEIHVIEKELLEEVLPYTYNVKYANNSTEYSYIGVEGAVEVDDVLLNTESYSIGVVTAVNTKNKNATKTFKGVKISTVPLE